jgi:hypothetical protein
VCQNFAVHAGTVITFDAVQATTIVQGDLGVHPGTDPANLMNGLYNFFMMSGEVALDSSLFAASTTAAHIAATQARVGGIDGWIDITSTNEMGGVTFTPGSYFSGSVINIASDTRVTLDGLNQLMPVFRFQAGSALNIGDRVVFDLWNGAKAVNVLWALGGSATVGEFSRLQGSVLATSIALGKSSRLDGCALAQASVTFAGGGIVVLPSSIPLGPAPTPAPVVSLAQGSCQNFAVHSQTNITFEGVTSTIRGGDLGVSPGSSLTGPYTFEGGGEVVSDSSAFAASVLAAHPAAMAVRADGKTMSIEMGGVTFTPGTYRSGSAINFALGTVVTLDGLNQPNPEWLFQAGTTLVTAANTYFVLKNGALAENVVWALGTSAVLGSNSVLEGSILVAGVITLGAQAKINGCVLAQGSVTFAGGGIVVLPSSIPLGPAPTPSPVVSVAQRSCQNFAVYARVTITFEGVTSTICGGDLGVYPGPLRFSSFYTFEGGGEVVSDSSAFAASVLAAHPAAMAVRADGKPMFIEMGGETFTPGTYRSSSVIHFAGGTVVTLDGLNQPNPEWLFQAVSKLVTAPNTYFVLKNGALAENVVWAIGTHATLGANSVLEGSILAGGGITFGTQAKINGCALALSSVKFESAGTVAIPW